MAAGDVLTQGRLEAEIANAAKALNRLKSQAAALKAVTDGLGAAGVVALPVGSRVTGSTMVTADANVLISALGDMVTALNAWSTTFAAQIWGPGY